MPQTLIALSLAHVLADFIFQTRWMVAGKKRPLPMLVHVTIVLELTQACLGSLHWAALAVAGAHLAIDLIKTHLGRDGLAAFLADQAAHWISLIAVALIWPNAFASGIWGMPPALVADFSPVIGNLPQIMLFTTGAVIATRMGQFAVGKLMQPYLEGMTTDGLANGGAVIGLLERGLTFLLVLTGQAAGVGFLIAAKSFLRVRTIEDDRRLAEYVIIGTLASIGWALLAAFATQALLRMMG